jgi:hypothetical protein
MNGKRIHRNRPVCLMASILLHSTIGGFRGGSGQIASQPKASCRVENNSTVIARF